MTYYVHTLLKKAARRTLLPLLFLSAAQVTSVHGANVTLAWQPNPEIDLAGYRLYYGTSPQNYTQQVNAGIFTTATAPNLSVGTTYFFAVKAYNLLGLESSYSSELSYTVPSQTPAPSPTATPILPSIAGNVYYCSDPTSAPIPGVTLSLTGGLLGSTQSDASGNYLFSSLLLAGSYIVTPSKGRLPPGSPGINTIDVIALQRQFLTIGTIPPGCRLAAGDVNGDTAITTADVVATQRFALGWGTGIGNVGVYEFTPTNRTYIGLLTSQTGQDFAALVFGDVASGYVYRQGSGTSEPPKIGTVQEVTLPEVMVDLSVTDFTVAVTTTEINRGDRLVGFQGDFTFDETVVGFAENAVENAGLTNDNWNVSANILPGLGPIRTLRVSAYSNDFQPLVGSGTLFNLKMIRVSNVAGASTPMIWAATPAEFLFIDADLNSQVPSSAPPGMITLEAAPRRPPGQN